MKQMNQKTLKKVHVWVRAVIQLLYFLFIPSAYTAAFNGVKYIFTQMGAKSHLELTSFVVTLIALCLFTVVFGRFFCGFACAFGSLGDAVRALYVFICKKRKKKPVTMKASVVKYLQAVKYVVLVLLVVSCYTGVYSKTQGMSPWDVFSMLHAGNFKLGGYIVGLVILVLILVGMAFQERFFCRVLCPMGAVFSMLPVLPMFTLRRDRSECIRGCRACTMKCPSDIELAPDTAPELSGDCFQCQKCIDTCPKGNIHTDIRSLKGNEIWFTVLRAVLLLVLFKFISV
ncbi:4Fe-4S binding protein [uncultured Eubacterium sp.]|uniref:4Fe-4S binding protein n=1 Tax=uncultured Eubacterium sp. TaxID=165185 RepID=UPI0025983765|nr:4Fe-4S binding protein [uncultured Eubacterium sp.]